jgi:hypothetical protein
VVVATVTTTRYQHGTRYHDGLLIAYYTKPICLFLQSLPSPSPSPSLSPSLYRTTSICGLEQSPKHLKNWQRLRVLLDISITLSRDGEPQQSSIRRKVPRAINSWSTASSHRNSFTNLLPLHPSKAHHCSIFRSHRLKTHYIDSSEFQHYLR